MALAANADRIDPVPTPAPVTFWKPFVAGTVGGVFGLSLVYPLDTVKVRIQTRPRGTYTGVLNCLTTTVKNEGYLALYRGIASPVAGYGAIKAVAFGSNKYACDTLTQWNDGRALHVWELVVCGGMAGVAQTFIRAPVEQIKVVMQSRNKAGSTTAAPYSSTFACLKDVVRTEGVGQGLYRSFWPTLWREIPQYALYFPLFELSRKFIKTSLQVDELTPLYTALAGGIAGVGQWLPTYPLDVIKSKVSVAPPGTYTGTMDCVRKAIAADGVMVLFRGLSASLIRAFPLHGAVFVGYEFSMKFLQ